MWYNSNVGIFFIREQKLRKYSGIYLINPQKKKQEHKMQLQLLEDINLLKEMWVL